MSSTSAAAARIASSSPGSLTARSASTSPPAGDELDPVGQRLAQAGRALRTDTCWSSKPSAQLARPASPAASAARSSCGAGSQVEAVDLAPWRARRSGESVTKRRMSGPTTAIPFVPVKPVR